ATQGPARGAAVDPWRRAAGDLDAAVAGLWVSLPHHPRPAHQLTISPVSSLRKQGPNPRPARAATWVPAVAGMTAVCGSASPQTPGWRRSRRSLLPLPCVSSRGIRVAELELTILMPCLNEAETLATCIVKARGFLERTGIAGEVLIADNGSTDGSQVIAEAAGARVVTIPEKGYGAALGGGIAAARGRYVIMGDADDSYDFSKLDRFIDELRRGTSLVMGNRFAGGIARGAMPWLHKSIGNPVLSFLGKLFFRTPASDFHCGLRGFDRDAILGLSLRTTGMEFASEMLDRKSTR